MTKRRDIETPMQLAKRIIYEENTAIVPENNEWLMLRIAQAIEVDRAKHREADPCQECGMRHLTPFVGTPVCRRYPEADYSPERKSELSGRGCFTFRVNS